MKNQKGFSLLELIVASAITVLLALTMASLLGDFFNQQQRLRLMTNAGLTRLELVSNIQNSDSWKKTLADPANTNMDCLRHFTPCSTGGPFRLVTSSGSVLYDGADSSSGFTSDGAPCNTYRDSGNDQCPIHIDLGVKANKKYFPSGWA